MTEWTNALAREVLELAHEDETVTVCSVPDNKVAALARAVLRVEALADGYDAEARLEMREGNVTDSINTQATADRIRTALNGEAA